MDDQSEVLRTKYDVNKHLVDKVWCDETKGLRKEVISFRYASMVRASELSKCLVEILDVKNWNEEKHKSNYIKSNEIGKEFWIEIGHAVTAVDCYIEEFLKQMYTNETSNCFIAMKSSTDEITITLRMKRIEFGGYYAEQSIDGMYELAKLYKENGVKMFKDYPLFAHNYFNLAAKCLLSYNIHGEEDIINEQSTTLTRTDFNGLLHKVYLNIAACLIKQNRHEEVLHVLSYVKTQDKPSEKAVYRLAQAYFHTKDFESAVKLMEKVDYKQNKDLAQLMAISKESMKAEKSQFTDMYKKMLFS